MRKKLEKPLLILLGAAFTTVILLQFEFSRIEATFYDWRMSFGPQKEANPGIVLITLDDYTTQKLEDFAPLPLDYHAKLLERLETMHPQAIGYLVNMNYVNQANPDLFTGEWGSRFVNAAQRLESQNIPLIMGTPFDVNGEVLPPFPLSSINHGIAILHRDGNVFSEDKVTRRALTTLYGKPTFHKLLAEKSGFTSTHQEITGSYAVPEVEGQYFFFRYHGDSHTSQYKRISFYDVLEGNVAPSDITGKILLIGTLARENPNDFALTPYSTTPFTHPKIIVHANIIDSIISNDGIRLTPNWVTALITFISSALVIGWIMTKTPLYGLLSTIGLTALLFLTSLIFFKGFDQINGIWIKISQPLIGIITGYYLFIPYRLIREYKKRWDYQRKNEILTQVEELKTNFLSLVTHDLKTPVARIQGLTELVMRETQTSQGPLLNIIKSTQELNAFITRVLELTKVESNELKLNLESKDINHIIEKSIESFSPIAQSKQIKIQTELEPLFPIKVDAALILKVINNLIDNAIKYSTENSTITIRSFEKEGQVHVQIADQGVGLKSDEIEHIFTKFYRAKNNATASSAGTGLGLYLTKYFIERHQGFVDVESQYGKGSVFKIHLPIQ